MKILPLLILFLIYGGVIFAIKSLCYPKNGVHKSTPKSRYLFRSQNNRVIAGVCGGIAQYFGCSAIAVRLLFLFTGIGIFTYAILANIIPESPSTLP